MVEWSSGVGLERVGVGWDGMGDMMGSAICDRTARVGKADQQGRVRTGEHARTLLRECVCSLQEQRERSHKRGQQYSRTSPHGDLRALLLLMELHTMHGAPLLLMMKFQPAESSLLCFPHAWGWGWGWGWRWG